MRTSVSFTFADVEVYADLVFDCTYRGSPGGYNDPPESPDFEVEECTLYLDDGAEEPKPLECPKWLADAICNSDRAYEKMHDEYRDSLDWGD